MLRATGSTLAKLRLPVIDPLLCECQPCLLGLSLRCKAALNIKPPELFVRTTRPVYDNQSGPTLAVGKEMSRHALDMMSLVALVHCQPVAACQPVILCTLILLTSFSAAASSIPSVDKNTRVGPFPDLVPFGLSLK